MSIDSRIKEETLGVQIQVSSKKIQMLLEKGISPSEILSDVIENLSEDQINEISKDGKIKDKKIESGVLSLIDNKKTVNEEDIINYCKEKMAGFKRPKHVIFGELPKTSTGKIKKFELKLVNFY